MTQVKAAVDGQRDVPQALIHALFRYPEALQLVLDEAGLAPHEVAMWARQVGSAPEIEKLAGWLSVGWKSGHYKPLLEVASSHLRAGELLDALPVFRWAYRSWRAVPDASPKFRYDGVKLLALWGECLHRLNQPEEARKRWLWSLVLIQDADTLTRLARTIERTGAKDEYQAVLKEALQRGLPGAGALWQRWQRMATAGVPEVLEAPASATAEPGTPPPDAPGVAVMADVANLDMGCGDQYGFGRRLDYGRLLQAAEQRGRVQVKLAFVPDIPDTLAVREHLEQAGFELDLKRPKRSHGRIVANADTAMASFAVRWASDPQIGRVELWTGDGDFLKAREAINQAWPDVAVAFRSFEGGTATGIRRLGDAWSPIGPQYVKRET